jgi:PIN domain nuclease of toxin-antitoxin system
LNPSRSVQNNELQDYQPEKERFQKISMQNWTRNSSGKLEQLPPLHKDPFDRLLVAQALVESFVIATKDPLICAYPDLEILWN